jgi:hypothetical protein
MRLEYAQIILALCFFGMLLCIVGLCYATQKSNIEKILSTVLYGAVIGYLIYRILWI